MIFFPGIEHFSKPTLKSIDNFRSHFIDFGKYSFRFPSFTDVHPVSSFQGAQSSIMYQEIAGERASDRKIIKSIDFTQGFSRWHFRWQLPNPVTNGKPLITAKFSTAIPIGDGESTTINWEMKIEDQISGQTIDGKESKIRWVGLELVSGIEHSLPVVYRVALSDETLGLRKSWGRFHVFRDLFIPGAWDTFTDRNDLEYFGGIGATLHLFLAIPISACKSLFPQPQVAEIKFDGDDPEDVDPVYQRLYETVVLPQPQPQQQQQDNDDDEENPFADADADPETEEETDEEFANANPGDFVIKAIDKEKRIERIFNCHRLILTNHSAVFRRLLRRRRTTSTKSIGSSSQAAAPTQQETNTSVLKVDDSGAWIYDGSEDGMEAVLRYIYTGRAPNLFDYNDKNQHMARLMNVASATAKFEIEELKDFCLSFLLFDYCTDEYRVDQLRLAATHGRQLMLPQLEAVCYEQLASAFLVNNDTTPVAGLPVEMQQKITSRSYFFLQGYPMTPTK